MSATTISRGAMVNAYEIEASMMLFAGKTVWCMPERFRAFTTRHYTSQHNLTLPNKIVKAGQWDQNFSWWSKYRLTANFCLCDTYVNTQSFYQPFYRLPRSASSHSKVLKEIFVDCHMDNFAGSRYSS